MINFIKEHEILVLDPTNNISIGGVRLLIYEKVKVLLILLLQDIFWRHRINFKLSKDIKKITFRE